jgi:hypothetical protein
MNFFSVNNNLKVDLFYLIIKIKKDLFKYFESLLPLEKIPN